MKKFILSLIFITTFSICNLKAQVINIEGYRIKTDTTGWAGSGDVSAYLAKYDHAILSFLTNLQFQYKQGKSLWLFLTDVATVQADNEKFVNSGFQHFRYNYKITDRFVAEAFAQGQYNEPLAIDYRVLIGAGPRYKIVGTEKFRLYIASLYMHEIERNTGVENLLTTERLSSYVSFTLSPNDNYSFTNTTYLQPSFSNFADYRLSTVSSLKVYFGKFGYMKLFYSLLEDTKPAEGVPTTIYTLMGGLGIEF